MFVGVCSDVGKIREINQDSYFKCNLDDFPIFVVADGMGGYKAGEVASRIVVETVEEMVKEYKEELVKKELEVPKFINEVLNESNNRVYEKSNSNEEYEGMGTTVTMAVILNNEIYIGHIGDSRAYLIRNEEIMQITQDHSLVAELVRNGSISEVDAINHPQKNIITRALGTDATVKIDILSKDVEEGDIILLCTDGLSNMVSDGLIKEILLSAEDKQEACEKLVSTANELGGLDNITALVIEVKQEKR
ncbi:Stp1/IreP family PP2C-type Ser/Thr phosphatase [Sporosalibacterium faouarense]|uniref:Stp1/IreP family PP2C-type Ser/Thr phosphatase n=1 Tax=Sporosalibacterium faouarense TaxID=516123 RepID=UPI00141C4E54|nr:Stp1/IreP family PP2C-type Ser/Thr phosphatase [Sporosalibacterium faouarense]MTI47721.1 Stp1/IreP family PP2C-type Ser/Thr phosphatase [Bacillota bacterium]